MKFQIPTPINNIGTSAASNIQKRAKLQIFKNCPVRQGIAAKSQEQVQALEQYKKIAQ